MYIKKCWYITKLETRPASLLCEECEVVIFGVIVQVISLFTSQSSDICLHRYHLSSIELFKIYDLCPLIELVLIRNQRAPNINQGRLLSELV